MTKNNPLDEGKKKWYIIDIFEPNGLMQFFSGLKTFQHSQHWTLFSVIMTEFS